MIDPEADWAQHRCVIGGDRDAPLRLLFPGSAHSPVSAWAQVRSAKLQNREVWQIESPQLRVTITQVGGHVAEILLKGKERDESSLGSNRPTIEPTEFVREKHEKLYGGGPAARLLSGLVGHNLCFPYWGDPSDSEYQAGMTFHGETGIVRWRKIAESQVGEGSRITMAAELPESRTRFTRTISSDCG